MGLILYVVIGFSEASSVTALESIFFHYTTLGIHSTAEMPAPKVQSATRESPPPFFPAIHVSYRIGFPTLIYPTTVSMLLRQIVDRQDDRHLLLISAYANIFYTRSLLLT